MSDLNPRIVSLFTCIVALVWMTSASAQNTSLPRLHDIQKTKRNPFLAQGCHVAGCDEHVGQPTPRVSPPPANYDMGPSIARSDSFDVQHYDLFLDVTDYGGQSMDAHATINFDVLIGGGNTVWWDLQGLVVDSVAWDGQPALFNQWDNRLHVQPSSTMAAGDNVSLEVWYGGQPDDDPYWGGMYYASNIIYNLGIGLTSIPPNFGRVWYPCFDNFVERATYTYHIKSAGGRRAHNQGHLVESIELGGDTVQSTWNLDHPIPTHLSAIAVGPFVDVESVHNGLYGDIPIRLTCKAADSTLMKAKFTDLGFAIDALEHWWGPYAWERVGYVLTTDGALEIPTNIAYPRSMIEQNLFANGDLFAHELGHHWWGDLVAPTIHNHMWLKEGPAEYSSHLFTEWKDGHEAFVGLVKDNQQFVLEECHIQDEGFHPLSPMPDDHIYGRHTYYKGASVMHNLRAYLGDSLFREATQNVIAERFDGHMDVGDFESLLEAFTGQEVTPFFEAQALQPGFSTWVVDSVHTAPANGCLQTTVYIQQKLRACFDYHDNEALDLTVWDAQWDTTLVHARVGGQFDEITFWHEAPFALLGLNADGKLNQGRLDHTFAVTEPTGLATLPWVEMRLGCDEISEGDSALVRIEHHWAAPDNGWMSPYVDELSDTHFWVVDGSWEDDEAGAPVLDARLNYVGNSEEDLDFGIYGDTEEGAFLAWRPRPDAPWIQYPDYDWTAGSLLNGAGVFKVSKLRKGQYAFAKGDVSLDIQEWANAQTLGLVTVPNPASDVVRWNWASNSNKVTAEVFNTQGQCVMRVPHARGELHVDGLANGVYNLRLADHDRRRWASTSMVVAH